MSGIRIDGALGRTVRKREISLERFDSRIDYEHAEIFLVLEKNIKCDVI